MPADFFERFTFSSFSSRRIEVPHVSNQSNMFVKKAFEMLTGYDILVGLAENQVELDWLRK